MKDADKTKQFGTNYPVRAGTTIMLIFINTWLEMPLRTTHTLLFIHF